MSEDPEDSSSESWEKSCAFTAIFTSMEMETEFSGVFNFHDGDHLKTLVRAIFYSDEDDEIAQLRKCSSYAIAEVFDEERADFVLVEGDYAEVELTEERSYRLTFRKAIETPETEIPRVALKMIGIGIDSSSNDFATKCTVLFYCDKTWITTKRIHYVAASQPTIRDWLLNLRPLTHKYGLQVTIFKEYGSNLVYKVHLHSHFPSDSQKEHVMADLKENFTNATMNELFRAPGKAIRECPYKFWCDRFDEMEDNPYNAPFSDLVEVLIEDRLRNPVFPPFLTEKRFVIQKCFLDACLGDSGPYLALLHNRNLRAYCPFIELILCANDKSDNRKNLNWVDSGVYSAIEERFANILRENSLALEPQPRMDWIREVKIENAEDQELQRGIPFMEKWFFRMRRSLAEELLGILAKTTRGAKESSLLFSTLDRKPEKKKQMEVSKKSLIPRVLRCGLLIIFVVIFGLFVYEVVRKYF